MKTKYLNNNNIYLSDTVNSTNASTGGTFTDLGGAGIAKDLYIGGQLFVDNINITPSIGDLYEQSFYGVNNQIIPANITGFNFNNTQVRYFQAIVSIVITTSSVLISGYELKGINLGGNWQLNTSSIGQNTGITFSITGFGQIQYTSKNITGWSSTLIKFKATTTSI